MNPKQHRTKQKERFFLTVFDSSFWSSSSSFLDLIKEFNVFVSILMFRVTFLLKKKSRDIFLSSFLERLLLRVTTNLIINAWEETCARSRSICGPSRKNGEEETSSDVR